MKISPDGSLDEWLAEISGAAAQFDWDAGNRGKNRKHGSSHPRSSRSYTALFSSRAVSSSPHTTKRAGCCLEKPMRDAGWRSSSPAAPTKLRPISCRAMRRNERRLYDDAKAKLEGLSEKGR